MPTLEEVLAQNENIPSRFQRLMTPANFLDEILATKTTTHGHDRRLATLEAKTKDRRVTGFIAGDPQYEAEMRMAEVLQGFPAKYDDITDGVIWTEPLVNVQPGDEYYVRVRISQHMVDPLLQGFRIRWVRPPGWIWIDGLGSTTTDEAISNPLVVVRVAQAPESSDPRRGFRAIVQATYPQGITSDADAVAINSASQPVTATGLVVNVEAPTEG